MDTGKGSSLWVSYSIEGTLYVTRIPIERIAYVRDEEGFTAVFRNKALAFRFDCWADLRRFDFVLFHNDREFFGDLANNWVYSPVDAKEEDRIITQMWELQKGTFLARPLDMFPEFVYF